MTAGQTGADAGQHQRSPGFEGMDARRNGLPCEACPYEPGPARTAWVVGWYTVDPADVARAETLAAAIRDAMEGGRG